MMEEETALRRMAVRLGLVASSSSSSSLRSSSSVTRKAEELMRLLAVNGGSGLALGMSARAVICLEMAASLTGTSLDKSMAIRLSGLTRTHYVGMSQTVSRLLNVSQGINVADLCVTHSATAATDLAHQVLKQYESCGGTNQGNVDVNLPLYQTAAVSASCKVMKIKVDQRRLFESSCSKRAVYQRLVEVMTKIAQEKYNIKTLKIGSKRTRTFMDVVEENVRACSEKRNKDAEKNDEIGNNEEEGADDADFEAWKKRILEAAAATE